MPRNHKEKESSFAGKTALVGLAALVEGRARTKCATVLRQTRSSFSVTIPVETGT